MMPTFVFFLLHDPRVKGKPFRAVGGLSIGAPWVYDESFSTHQQARDRLFAWISNLPKAECHDLTE